MVTSLWYSICFSSSYYLLIFTPTPLPTSFLLSSSLTTTPSCPFLPLPVLSFSPLSSSFLTFPIIFSPSLLFPRFSFLPSPYQRLACGWANEQTDERNTILYNYIYIYNTQISTCHQATFSTFYKYIWLEHKLYIMFRIERERKHVEINIYVDWNNKYLPTLVR